MGHGFKERSGYIVIVDRFEQAKAADVRLVQRIVVRIVTGHDAADDFVVSPRQKQGSVAVPVKRMPFSVEEHFTFND